MRHTKAKMRLAVLLCIAMVLPSIVMALPSNTMDAEAASNMYLCWDYTIMDYSTTEAKIIVEQGQKFILSDWFTYSYSKGKNNYYGSGSELTGYKVSSSKKSVATLSKKGVVNTKKTGTTVLTMKKSGVTMEATVQVVKKGSLTKLVKNSEKYQKNAKAVISAAGTKITAKNAKKVFDGILATEGSVKTKKLVHGVYCKNGRSTHKMLVPQYGTYNKMNLRFSKWVDSKTVSLYDTTNVGTTAFALDSITMTSAKQGYGTLKREIPIADYIRAYCTYNEIYGIASGVSRENGTYEQLKNIYTDSIEYSPADLLYTADGNAAGSLTFTFTYGSKNVKLESFYPLAAGTYTTRDLLIGNVNFTVAE